MASLVNSVIFGDDCGVTTNTRRWSCPVVHSVGRSSTTTSTVSKHGAVEISVGSEWFAGVKAIEVHGSSESIAMRGSGVAEARQRRSVESTEGVLLNRTNAEMSAEGASSTGTFIAQVPKRLRHGPLGHRSNETLERTSGHLRARR